MASGLSSTGEGSKQEAPKQASEAQSQLPPTVFCHQVPTERPWAAVPSLCLPAPCSSPSSSGSPSFRGSLPTICALQMASGNSGRAATSDAYCRTSSLAVAGNESCGRWWAWGPLAAVCSAAAPRATARKQWLGWAPGEAFLPPTAAFPRVLRGSGQCLNWPSLG